MGFIKKLFLMNNIVMKKFSIFLLFFSSFIFQSIFFDSQNSLFGPFLNLDWNITYQEILDQKGGDDASSYIRIGELIFRNGFFYNLYAGSFNLWPFGMPAVHASIMNIFGLKAHPIPIFFFAFVLIWSFLFTLAILKIDEIRCHKYKLLFFCVLLFVSQSNLVSVFFLRQSLLLSEGISTPLFILSLFFIFKLSEEFSYKVLFGAVLLLLCAALTRVTIDFFMTGLFLSYLIYLALAFYKPKNNFSLAWTSTSNYINNSILNKICTLYFSCINLLKKKPILFVLIMYEIILFPYRCMIHNVHQSFSLTVADYSWTQNWMPDEYLVSKGGGWVVDGAVNTPCHIDLATCNFIYQREFIKDNPYSDNFKYYKYMTFIAMLNHPYAWLSEKWPVFIKYWFAEPPEVASARSFSYANLGSALAGLGILFLGVSGFSKKRTEKVLGSECFVIKSIIPFVFLFTSIAPYFLLHFEVRYFFPVKIHVYFLLLLLVTYNFRNNNRKVS
jgi:hypothetical protein